MHGMNIAHRNIKLENIMFTDDTLTQVKVINFRDATFLDANGHATTICGTNGYLAPELFEETPYSATIDIWSLGVVMYALLMGLMPFQSGVKPTHDKSKKRMYEIAQIHQVS
jgi:serine/threonine protein kinase